MAKKVVSSEKRAFVVLDTNYPKINMTPRVSEKAKKEPKEKKPRKPRKVKTEDAPKKTAQKKTSKKMLKKD
jgi:hypothetical protein